MIRDLDLPLSAFHFPREKNGQGILSTQGSMEITKWVNLCDRRERHMPSQLRFENADPPRAQGTYSSDLFQFGTEG